MKHTITALAAGALLAATSAAALAQTKNMGNPNSTTTNETTTDPNGLNTTSSTANQPGASSSTTMNANVASASMSAERVKQIQGALDKNGQHVTVDGRWGKQTAAAVRNFQKQNGLHTTGKADQQTMQKLGLTSG